MRNLVAVLMFAAGLTAMPAHAEDITGTKLAEYCASPYDSFLHGACGGYILGVSDTMNYYHLNYYDKECIPSTATRGQVIKVIMRYLDDKPEKLHRHAHFLIVNALIEGFDCNDGLSYPL